MTTRTMAASCGSAVRTSASRRRPADLIGSETGRTLGKPGRVRLRPRLVAILEPLHAQLRASPPTKRGRRSPLLAAPPGNRALHSQESPRELKKPASPNSFVQARGASQKCPGSVRVQGWTTVEGRAPELGVGGRGADGGVGARGRALELVSGAQVAASGLGGGLRQRPGLPCFVCCCEG